jgi:hypothetical protein
MNFRSLPKTALNYSPNGKRNLGTQRKSAIKELQQVFGMKFEKNENVMNCRRREEGCLLGLGPV